MDGSAEPRFGTAVRVLDEDLELAAAVDQISFRDARLAAVAPLIEIPRGPWARGSGGRTRRLRGPRRRSLVSVDATSGCSS